MSGTDGTDSRVFKPGTVIEHQGRRGKVLSARTKLVSSSTSSLQIYVHYDGQDPRYDDWQDASPEVHIVQKDAKKKGTGGKDQESSASASAAKRGKKRPLHASPAREGEHTTPLAARRVNLVYFGWHEINCWYDSPYPIQELRTLYPDPSVEPTVSSLDLHRKKDKGKQKQQTQLSAPSSANSSRATTPLAPEPGPPAAKKKKKMGRKDEGVVHNGAAQPSDQAAPGTSTAMSAQPSNPRNHTERFDGTKLYVCDGCMKYMLIESVFTAHKKLCQMRHPPGRKVYQRGGHIIWEVDGAKEKLWCQNLALLGKLFIDHKYVTYDVECFHFYVLTEGLPSKDWTMGFFSKEKRSFDNYNLACIITLPPFQNKGYARLLIEMSYALSKRAQSNVAGTPERPLSDLGLRTYVAYWVNVIVRYLRERFQVLQSSSTPSSSTRTRSSPKKGKGKKPKADSGAAVQERDGVSTMSITLTDLANACGFRVEDVACALERCGLAQYRRPLPNQPEDDTAMELLITPEQVESVATRWKVRPAYLQESCLLL